MLIGSQWLVGMLLDLVELWSRGDVSNPAIESNMSIKSWGSGPFKNAKLGHPLGLVFKLNCREAHLFVGGYRFHDAPSWSMAKF